MDSVDETFDGDRTMNDRKADTRVIALAEKHKLTLCSYCNQPLELHVGFNRPTRMCELGVSNISLLWKHQNNHKKVAAILKRVDMFWREWEALVETENFTGSGI